MHQLWKVERQSAIIQTAPFSHTKVRSPIWGAAGMQTPWPTRSSGSSRHGVLPARVLTLGLRCGALIVSYRSRYWAASPASKTDGGHPGGLQALRAVLGCDDMARITCPAGGTSGISLTLLQ